MNASPPSPLWEQKNKQRADLPALTLDQQPNVILDLIFSYFDLSDLESAVFPVSRRLSGQLRRRSVAVVSSQQNLLCNRPDLPKFLFLTRHWNLRSLDLLCGIDYEYSSEFDFSLLKGFRDFLNIGQECPKLENAKLTIRIPFTDKTKNADIRETIDVLIGSFSGCRFLRSFDYDGPRVPSLGRLQQIELLRLYPRRNDQNLHIILQNLSQLRSILYSSSIFSPECLKILQSFPALEEIECLDSPTEALEELIKFPGLKSLIITCDVDFDFPPIWEEFKTLERLALRSLLILGNMKILPAIPSLKEVEMMGDFNYPIPLLSVITKFLSLNIQLESLIIPVWDSRGMFCPEDLLDLVEILETLKNIKTFRMLEKGEDAFNKAPKQIAYSCCVTDRFLFRSPEHRQEFIESLRTLALSKRRRATTKSSIVTRRMKQQKPQTLKNNRS